MNITLVGFGAMGQGIGQLISNKEGCNIVSIVDKDPQKTGKKVDDFINVKNKNGLTIKGSMDELQDNIGDIAIITTGSFIKNIAPLILQAVNVGMHVITIAEEMLHPRVSNATLADEIDKKAQEKKVTVLGTGINPGFVLDLLIIVLSSVCHKVKSIKAKRVNDLSSFGSTVLKAQGIGLEVEQFEAGLKNGSIMGHVGFFQSIALISETFGWEIDDVVEEKYPIIARNKREHANFTVNKGMVAGFDHSVKAKSNGKTVIELNHPQQVFPETEGFQTKDEIIINGTPNIHLKISPEIHGGIGTIAMPVNMLPLVMEAKKGLITMRELPKLPSLFQGIIS